jgi:hypothetical protein
MLIEVKGIAHHKLVRDLKSTIFKNKKKGQGKEFSLSKR